MRKRAMGRVDYEKKIEGVRVDHKKYGWGESSPCESDGVSVHHERKSDGVRNNHQKERWSESSP